MSKLWKRNGWYYYSGHGIRFSLKTRSKTRAEIIQKRLDEKYEYSRFGIIIPTNKSAREVCDEWQYFIRNDKSDSWWQTNRFNIKTFLNKHGSVPIKAITTAHLNSYISDLKETKAPNTVLNYLKPIRQMLKYAVSNGYIETNPMDSALLPTAEIRRENQPIPKGFLDIIFQLADDKDGTFWMVCYYTGLDSGDAGTIKREYVRNNIIYTTRKKTKVAVPIPLHPELNKLDIFNCMPTRNMRSSSSKRLKNICKGLGFYGNIKCLRHSFVSHLFDAGYSLDDIRIVAGHTKAKMTGHYTKAQIDTIRTAINCL